MTNINMRTTATMWKVLQNPGDDSGVTALFKMT
jgi:hypothetical protein